MGRLRTNLERLLRSCDELSGSLEGRAERRRYETYLTVLLRQWQALADERTCPAEVLGEFRRKIERLAELLDEGKLLSGSGSALALAQAQCNANLTRSQVNAELSTRLREKERMQQALRSQLSLAGASGPPSTPKVPDAARSDAASATARAVSDARKAILGPGASHASPRAATGDGGVEAEALGETLRSERSQQDRLIEEMSKSVGELRDRSIQARACRAHDAWRGRSAPSPQAPPTVSCSIPCSRHGRRCAMTAIRSTQQASGWTRARRSWARTTQDCASRSRACAAAHAGSASC